MIWLILSILLSTTIFVIFKLLSKYQITVLPVILINYFVCSIFGLIMVVQQNKAPELFNWTANYLYPLALGIVFIVTFLAMAKSTDANGTGLTSMLSKMSVLIPIAVAVIFLNEKLSTFKVVGIALSLIGVFILLHRKEKHASYKFGLLILVFVGSGIVDTGLNLLKSRLLTDKNEWVISTLIFFSAFILGGLYYVFIHKQKQKWNSSILISGTALGIINLLSIVCLLQAVKAFQGETGLLFILNNVSVVLLSYLFSMLFFKEKINLKTAVGILVVIFSMVLLNL